MRDGPLLLEWIQANHAWLGYVVMALLGGATAHILSFEKAEREWAWYEHILGFGSALIKAWFVAIIVFYLAQQYAGWPPPLCFVIAGIGSVFASETIRWGYDKGRAFFDARLPGGGNDSGKKSGRR